MDYSMPGFLVLHCFPQFAQIHVHWVSDARESESHSILSNSLWPHGLYPASSSVLCSSVHGILQAGILEWLAFPFSRGFPTQGSNPDLPHCRRILYRLSHEGSPPSSNHLTFISDLELWWMRSSKVQIAASFLFFTHMFSCGNREPPSWQPAQFSDRPGASQPEG